MGYFGLDDDYWDSLYEENDPLNPDKDKRRDLLVDMYNIRQGEDSQDDGYFGLSSFLGGVHGDVAGYGGAGTDFFWEGRDLVNTWNTDPSSFIDPETGEDFSEVNELGERGVWLKEKEPLTESLYRKLPFDFSSGVDEEGESKLEGLGATFNKIKANVVQGGKGLGLAAVEWADQNLPEWMLLDETINLPTSSLPPFSYFNPNIPSGVPLDEAIPLLEDEFLESVKERKEAERIVKEKITDRYEDFPDPEAARLGGEIGTTIAQEIPIMLGTMGTGLAVGQIGKQAVKYGASRLGREVSEKAVTRLANRASQNLRRKIGLGLMAGIHGTRSGAGTYSDALDTYASEKVDLLTEVNPDLSEDQILDIAYSNSAGEALLPAALSGAATASLVAVFGATGLESLLKTPTGLSSVSNVLKSTFKQSGFEGVEELSDSLAQSLIQYMTYNPDKTWKQVVDEGIKSFLLGGLMGGTFTGIGSLPKYADTKVQIWRSNRKLKKDKKEVKEDFRGLARKNLKEITGEEPTEEQVEEVAEKLFQKIIENNETVLAEAEAVETDEDVPVVYDEDLNEEELDAKDEAYAEYQKQREAKQAEGITPEQRDSILEQANLDRKREQYIAEELNELQDRLVPTSALEASGLTAQEFNLSVARGRADIRLENEQKAKERELKEDTVAEEVVAPELADQVKEEPVTEELTTQTETDYVIANTVKKKVGNKFNWVNDEQVKDSPIEIKLGYTLKQENPQEAVLKYNKNTKSWGVGYYLGTSKAGKPKFNEEFTIVDQSAIETIYDSKDRVVGARIPKRITTKEFISNDQNKEEGNVWKITKPTTESRTEKAKSDSAPQQEIAVKVVENIKNKSVQSILKPLVKEGQVTLTQIRAVINTAKVTNPDGSLVKAATVIDPVKLGKHFLKALSNLSNVELYKRAIGESETIETGVIQEAASLKSKNNASKPIRTVAVLKLLQAAGEKYDADRAGVIAFDEGRQALGTGRLRPTTEQTREEALEEFAPEDFEVDPAQVQQEKDREEQAQQQEDIVAANQAGQRTQTLEDKEADAFIKEQADQLEELTQSSNERVRNTAIAAIKQLDNLNVNPETMTRADQEKAMKFARRFSANPEVFYQNLFSIKTALAGSIRNHRSNPSVSSIPVMPKAKGAKQIKELVNRGDNGLTEDQKRVFNKFLEVLDEKTLALLTLEITGNVDLDGNETISFDGTFNALTNIAKIANSANPEVVAEEIAHFTAKLLPERYRKQAKKLQLKAFEDREEKIKKLLEKAEGKRKVILQTALDVVAEAKKNAGELSSADYARIQTNAASKNGIALSEIPNDRSLYYDSIAGSVAAFERGSFGSGTSIKDYDKSLVLIDKPQVDTPEFLNWFGNSSLTTESGQPLIFFHATTFDGSIEQFNELAGYEARQGGLSEPVRIDNNRRIGHFFSPDPVFGQLLLGNPEPSTDEDSPYQVLQRALMLGGDNAQAKLKSFSSNMNIYPAFIRVENLFDGSNPDHRQQLGVALKRAVSEAKYLLGEIDSDKGWSDGAKLRDVLNYQKQPDIQELEDFGYSPESIQVELDTYAEESARINEAINNLSVAFGVETVGQVKQIIEKEALLEAGLGLELADPDKRFSFQSDADLVSAILPDIEKNYWGAIELYTRFIKYAGFDGYNIQEFGRNNIAVFENNQVKSAITAREFSPDPQSKISASLSQEQEDALNEIDDLLYDVINPDEFYARNLVKQSTEGIFKRGLETALDIVSGLLDNSLIRVDSVATRREKRKFFSEVEKMLKTGKGLDFNRAAKPGGLLTRSAINAGSINPLESANKLESALNVLRSGIVIDEETGQDVSGNKEASDILMGQAAVSVSVIDKVLRKHMPKDISKDGYRMLLRNFSDDIGRISAESVLPKEYKEQYDKFMEEGREELANSLALVSLQLFKKFQSRMRWIETNYQSKVKELNSDKVQKLLSNAHERFNKAERSREVETEIANQLRFAVNALAAEGLDLRASGILLEIAGDEQTLRENQVDAANIKGKAASIARVLAKSNLFSEMLTINPNATASDVAAHADEILRAYAANRKIASNAPMLPAEGTEMYKRWKLAAGLLATRKSLQENALALVFEEDGELEGAGVQKFAKDLLKGLQHKDPKVRAEAIAKATRKVVDHSKKSERQRLLFQKSYKELDGLFNELQVLHEARQVAGKFLNDKEIKDYLARLNKDTNSIETPVFRTKDENDDPVFIEAVLPDQRGAETQLENNTLVIPVPEIFGKKSKVITVRILSDDTGDEHLAKMREAYDAITHWLSENGPSNPYFEYYSGWHSMLENIYMSELVMHPRQNVRAIASKLSLSVLDQTLNNIPGRSVEVTKQLVRRHNLYFQRMGAWANKYGDAWKNKMKAAALSHGLDASFTGVAREDTFKEWETTVGNELRASHQEGGRNLDIGDRLVSGQEITKEDIALLDFEGKITDIAYKLNQSIADLDKSVSPTYIIDAEKGRAPIVRLPLKRGKTFLPRVYSNESKTFLELYKDRVNLNEGAELGAIDFDAIFTGHPEALLSFIIDRNPEFITQPSELEQHYAIAAASIADGSLEKVSVESVLNLLSKRSSKDIPSIKKLILSEYKDILNTLVGERLPSETQKQTTKYIDLKAEGPFVKARKKANAPYYFYQYGFKDQSDLKRFALMGSAKPLENVIISIKAIQRDLDAMDLSVKKRRQQLINEGYVRGSHKLEKQLKKEFKLNASEGTNFIGTMDEINFWRRKLLEVSEQYSEAYSTKSAGSKLEINNAWYKRMQSSVVGSTLMAINTVVKNSTDASVIGGFNLAAAQGQSGASAFLKGLFMRWPISIGKLGVSTLASAVKFTVGVDAQLTKSVKGKKVGSQPTGNFLTKKGIFLKPKFSWDKPDLIFKSFPAILDGFIKARGVHRVIAPIGGFLAPVVEEVFQHMPMRIHEHRMLAERGLDMPITPIETNEAFLGDLVSGGSGINSYKTENEVIQAAVRSLNAGMGLAESGLSLIGRPIFPRIGDISGNNQLWNLGIQHVTDLQRQLDKVYDSREYYEDDLNEDISEEELLGRYLYIFRANKASFNNTLNMLAKGGVTNFQKEAKAYLQARARGEEDAQFLTDFQRNNVAEGWVTQSNSATPSNRPAWARLTQTANALMALLGWGTNAIQNFGNVMLGRSRKRDLKDSSVQSVAGIIWLLGFMASAYGAGTLAIAILNWIYGLMGTDNKKSLPTDKKEAKDFIRSAIGLGTSSVPMAGAWIEAVVGGDPSRGMMHPGSLLYSKASVLTKYLAETAVTKDPTYGMRSLAKGMVPLAMNIVDSLTDYGKGWKKFGNVMNAINRYYDPDDIKVFRGQTLAASISNIKPISEHVRAFQSAIGRGDLARAEELRVLMMNELLADAAKNEEVLGRLDAQRKLNQHLRAKTPLHYKLEAGTIPTRSEFVEDFQRKNFVTFMIDGWNKDESKWSGEFKEIMDTLDRFNDFYIESGISPNGIWDKGEEPFTRRTLLPDKTMSPNRKVRVKGLSPAPDI